MFQDVNYYSLIFLKTIILILTSGYDTSAKRRHMPEKVTTNYENCYHWQLARRNHSISGNAIVASEITVEYFAS